MPDEQLDARPLAVVKKERMFGKTAAGEGGARAWLLGSVVQVFFRYFCADLVVFFTGYPPLPPSGETRDDTPPTPIPPLLRDTRR